MRSRELGVAELDLLDAGGVHHAGVAPVDGRHLAVAQQRRAPEDVGDGHEAVLAHAGERRSAARVDHAERLGSRHIGAVEVRHRHGQRPDKTVVDDRVDHAAHPAVETALGDRHDVRGVLQEQLRPERQIAREVLRRDLEDLVGHDHRGAGLLGLAVHLRRVVGGFGGQSQIAELAELDERPRIRGQFGFHTQAAVGERGFKLLVGHLIESPVEIALDRALHRSRVHNFSFV